MSLPQVFLFAGLIVIAPTFTKGTARLIAGLYMAAAVVAIVIDQMSP